MDLVEPNGKARVLTKILLLATNIGKEVVELEFCEACDPTGQLMERI